MRWIFALLILLFDFIDAIYLFSKVRKIMNENKILLGFEVGTGKPIHLTLHHLVITGMTQLSGKTTTLEALIQRSGKKAIAFITKRGEIGFQQFHAILPYFKERSDWQYVESLIEATLRENQRFNRSWIIKACRGTKTLTDVLNNIEQRKEKARKDSLAESVYTNLAEYLKMVIPQIQQFQFSDQVTLQDGINVMDVSEMTLEMRNLVIRSVMEYALDKLSNTIIIIPEAWEYLPQYRSTPVKYYAEAFIRKGASVGNYLWVDSQDIAGIDKTPLRQCDNWILGRQKDVREVKRTREEIFKNTPTEQQIMTLKVGHFFACIGNEVHLVYVQPSWLSEDKAKKVALGEIDIEQVQDWFYEDSKARKQENVKDLKKQLEKTRKFLKDTEAERDSLQTRLGVLEQAEKTIEDLRELIQKQATELDELRPLKKLRDALTDLFPKVMSPSPTKEKINIEHKETTYTVTRIEEPIFLDTTTVTGKVLFCAVKDLEKQTFTETDLSNKLIEHGWNIGHSTLGPTLGRLVKEGKLIRIKGARPAQYRLPTKTKILTVPKKGVM